MSWRAFSSDSGNKRGKERFRQIRLGSTIGHGRVPSKVDGCNFDADLWLPVELETANFSVSGLVVGDWFALGRELAQLGGVEGFVADDADDETLEASGVDGNEVGAGIGALFDDPAEALLKRRHSCFGLKADFLSDEGGCQWHRGVDLGIWRGDCGLRVSENGGNAGDVGVRLGVSDEKSDAERANYICGEELNVDRPFGPRQWNSRCGCGCKKKSALPRYRKGGNARMSNLPRGLFFRPLCFGWPDPVPGAYKTLILWVVKLWRAWVERPDGTSG